jgi:hypothetical protein
MNYICIMEIGCSRFWVVLLNWKREIDDAGTFNLTSAMILMSQY